MWTGECSFQMIRSVSATCLLGFVVVWWSSFAGGFDLTCHCAPSGQCPDQGHCRNGCENGWYGPGCQIGNVALQKYYQFQSSTDNGDGFAHGPDKAVDGLIPSDSSAVHCSQTRASRGGQYWWIQFYNDGDVVIQNVTVLSRNDNSSLLSNFTIMYTPALIKEIYLVKWNTCVHVGQQQQNVSQSYSCGNGAVAWRMAIYLDDSASERALTLCEVIVNGYRKYDCPSGYTGPGCLLRDCTAVSCREDCNNTNGCYYLTCPNTTVIQPECWIKLPSIKHLNATTIVTCENITFIVDSHVDEVHHGNIEMLLELQDESNVTTYSLRATLNDFKELNLKVPAVAGKVYTYRIVMHWCSSNGSSCIFGNSDWRSVTTAQCPKVTSDKSYPSHTVALIAGTLSGVFVFLILIAVGSFFRRQRMAQSRTKNSEKDKCYLNNKGDTSVELYAKLSAERKSADAEQYAELQFSSVLEDSKK